MTLPLRGASRRQSAMKLMFMVSDLPDRLRDFATVSIGCWPSRV
jgi:hypothetical protein